jgi:hypothetical protein
MRIDRMIMPMPARDSEKPGNRIERELETLSDRLGSRANADHWFDEIVDSWRTHMGSRIPVLELAGIGEAIPAWVSSGDTRTAANVLEELEACLSDEGAEQVAAEGYALEVLDGVRNRLIALEERSPNYSSIRSEIELMMGERTRVIWDGLLSANE